MKYSGNQVSQAGRSLLNLAALSTEELNHAIDVMAKWRECHDGPLELAVKMVKSVVVEIDRSAIFAKRLKRLISIYNKLTRYETMDLRNMHDIGGCRVIVATEKKLRQAVRALRRRREFKSEGGKIRSRDYISHPKEDGYRSYHLIGRFRAEGGVTRNIELQIRTKVQHYWATAVEIVDIFTGQSLKSNKGESDWKLFFRDLGEQFAVIDSIHLVEDIPDRMRYKKYRNIIGESEPLQRSLKNVKRLCGKLRVVEKMEGYANSLNIANEQMTEERRRGYVLIKINTHDKQVHTAFYKEAESEIANAAYVAIEKEIARTEGMVAALVSSNAIGGIKEAYPNFFADSTEFIARLEFLQSA